MGHRMRTRLRWLSASALLICALVSPSGAPAQVEAHFLRAVAGLAPTNALHLRYYVRFSEGFDFVKGGKLPGLFGGAIPDGTNGFSVRYMWRTNGDGEAYAHLPTSDLYGTENGRGIFFSTFFGGGDPTWATPRDVHADFAAFALASAYVEP